MRWKKTAVLCMAALCLFTACTKTEQEAAVSSETAVPSQSETTVEEEKPEEADLAASEPADAGVTTLKQLSGGNGATLELGDFEELAVGWSANGNTQSQVLFDADGVVHHIFDEDQRIVSGFYDGMCLTSHGILLDENGNQVMIPGMEADETIIRYAKDDGRVLLWTIKQEDTIDGSNMVLKARNPDGSVFYQCDTTKEEFSNIEYVSDFYKELLQAGADSESEFSYCGAGIYRVGSSPRAYISVEKGMSAAESEYTAITSLGNIRYVAIKNGNMETLPGWENMASHWNGEAVLSDGLVFLDGYENTANGAKYPAGFYDVNLNCVIDLSQYNVLFVGQDEPQFLNGYAVLQLRNPDGVLFWGVMNRNGEWVAEPRKGNVKRVMPSVNGVLVHIDDGSESGCIYDETGAEVMSMYHMALNGYVGYARDTYTIHDGYLYLTLSDYDEMIARVAKISADNTVEFLN